MIKIYFAGSIRGGRSDAAKYNDLIAYIRTMAQVLTEHVGAHPLSGLGEEGLTDARIYVRDMEWLSHCDAVIAEVSTPSLGVGYEIARAATMGKPVLALFNDQSGFSLSAMISGSPDVRICRYQDISQAKSDVREFIAGIRADPMSLHEK